MAEPPGQRTPERRRQKYTTAMGEVELTVVADGLTKRFGFVYAVRDVTFALPRSSVLLVLGPNGSGKTTLLRLLATALRPTTGRAVIFGADLVRDSDAVRRATAFVGTAAGLYDSLSARENLEFAAAMCGLRVQPHAWLERVGLAALAEQPVRTFSQGMKRRLALARAWLRAPRLLLFDEPFSGLDVDGHQLVHDLIADVTSRGGSVMLSTHEWERGLKVADMVMALAGGRPMEVASAEQFSPPQLRVLTGSRR